MMSAAVAGPTRVRPTPSYTTLRDVTQRQNEIRTCCRGALISGASVGVGGLSKLGHGVGGAPPSVRASLDRLLDHRKGGSCSRAAEHLRAEAPQFCATSTVKGRATPTRPARVAANGTSRCPSGKCCRSRRDHRAADSDGSETTISEAKDAYKDLFKRWTLSEGSEYNAWRAAMPSPTGYWVVPPLKQIPVGGRAMMWLQDRPGLTGYAGQIGYSSDGMPYKLGFSCPFLSNNTVTPNQTLKFRARSGPCDWGTPTSYSGVTTPSQVQLMVT
jgi:hypothetical protein